MNGHSATPTFAELVEILKTFQGSSEEADGFYFYDRFGEPQGPYETKELANEAHMEYISWVYDNGPRRLNPTEH